MADDWLKRELANLYKFSDFYGHLGQPRKLLSPFIGYFSTTVKCTPNWDHRFVQNFKKIHTIL